MRFLWRSGHRFPHFQKLEGSQARALDLAHIMTKGMTSNIPQLASRPEDIATSLLREQPNTRALADSNGATVYRIEMNGWCAYQTPLPCSERVDHARAISVHAIDSCPAFHVIGGRLVSHLIDGRIHWAHCAQAAVDPIATVPEHGQLGRREWDLAGSVPVDIRG